MIAAIYSRKSLFSEKGDSVENQIQMCKDYANLNLRHKDIKEFLIYEDEGFSGGNTNRPQFKQLVLDAKLKKFDVLICYRLDRISRNVADFSTTLEILQRNDIDFVSIKEQFDTSTPMGRAMVYISSVFAQLERETIAERVRDNMLELAKSGRWLGGTPPFGFISESKKFLDEHLNPRSMTILKEDPKEMEIVKLIFSKYLEGQSLSYVQRYLLQNFIKTRNGCEFTLNSLSRILKNPVYVKSSEELFTYLKHSGIEVCGTPDNLHGVLTYNKLKTSYTIEGELVRSERDKNKWIAAVSKHEGVIESLDFLKVQSLIAKNSIKFETSARSTKALLTGILKCSNCGSRMKIVYSARNKKTGVQRTYYACTLKKDSGGVRCNSKNVRVDDLDPIVITTMKDLGVNKLKVIDTLKEKLNKASSSINSLDEKKEAQKQIQSRKNQMKNLIDKLSLDGDLFDVISVKIKELKSEIMEYEKVLFSIENSLDSIKENEINLDFISILLEKCSIFDTLDTVEQKLLIRNLTEGILWDGENNQFTIDLVGSGSNTS